jgi:hypothetical protein
MTRGDPWPYNQNVPFCRNRAKEVSRFIVANSLAKEVTSMTHVITPENISGFVVGEGCFYVEFGKDTKYLLGTRVRPAFVVELAEDDLSILEAMKNLLACGTVYHLDYGRYQKYHQKKWKRHVRYKVSNLTDIVTKLIPFFKNYPLFGKKAQAFHFFQIIVERMLKKKHLTKEGLKEIAGLVNDLHRINKRGTGDSPDAREALVRWGANQG